MSESATGDEHAGIASARREAEEQLALIIDNAPIGKAIVAPDGRWLRVNDALSRVVGYTRSELLASDFQRITHPDDLEADLACVKRLLAGQIASYEMDKRYLHRDGRVVWVHLTVSLVRNADGSPRFFISQVQDHTARRHAEARADLFFEHSVDMLAIAGTSGRLDVVNSAWQRTLGWSKAELTSTPFLEFVHPEDVERTVAEAEACYRGSPAASFRNRYRAIDGRYRWLEWRTVPTADGELFCVARDVTASIESELELANAVADLKRALSEIKTLRGLLPICMHCKDVRTDAGLWQQIEVYVRDRTEAKFSHCICPRCYREHYPEPDP